MMTELTFKCPDCGCQQLVERSFGSIYEGVASFMIDIEMPGEEEMEFGDRDCDGVEVKDYRCWKCDKVISEGASHEDLRDALLKLDCNATVREVVDSKAMEYPQEVPTCDGCAGIASPDDDNLEKMDDGRQLCRACIAQEREDSREGTRR